VSHAPVALFVYNRPAHTRQTVEALLANTLAGETPLYVFSDAPKSAAASSAVAEVRAYIRTIVGFKSVTIIERETNFGLARSIIDGVTGLCEKHGRVIVVEDDLITSPHFFSYMNDGLTRYEHEDRVMQIAGYMFPMELEILEDALFLPFITSWGWATWSRAWQHFDAEARGYQTLAKDRGLRERFDLGGHYRYFKMLQAQQEGKVDSWAIRWYLSVFLLDGLALWPKTTMVRNLGFDGSGVNCAVSKFEDSPLDINFRVLAMPQHVEVSTAYASVLDHFPVPTLSISSLVNRLLHHLKQSPLSRYMRVL
ncbi:MAG: hypothetical protein OEV77_15145, partial [Nitrospira sp.]|nr:hypothetical protein [Nitrospira sp.]